MTLIADLLYAHVELGSVFQSGTWIDAGCLLGYGLIAAASVAAIRAGQQTNTTTDKNPLSRPRVIIVAVAALPAPALSFALHSSGIPWIPALTPAVTVLGLTLWRALRLSATAERDLAQLRMSNEMLEAAGAKMQEALQRETEAVDELRALSELKSAFLQGLSHELRTPLTSIIGNASTLERVETSGIALAPGKRLKAIKTISTRSRQLGRLIEDLLDIDRLEQGEATIAIGVSDIDQLVLGIGENTDLHGHRLIIDVGDLIVTIDRPKVERILEALIGNAIKHTPEGTQVWVTGEHRDSELLLVVEDDGPGIPDGFKVEAFEAFKQGSTISKHSPGPGIGLTLVARLAGVQGGRVQVLDRVGGGARFEVRLPVPKNASVSVGI